MVAKHGLTVEYAVKGVPEARAFEIEAKLIAQYGRDKLCNLTDGGEGMRGHKKGPETIAKLKAAMAARDLTPELIEKMVGHRRGTKHSERTKALMRKSWDAERRAAHSAHRSATTKSRAIVCVETGQSFSRVNHAVDWLISSGVPRAAQGNLVACARGRRKSAYGYSWKYPEP